MTTLATTVSLDIFAYIILFFCLVTTILDPNVVVVSGFSIPSSSGQQQQQLLLQHRMPPSIQISPERLSSPERYAAAMNMTVQQVQERKENFRLSSENLHQRLRLVEEEQKQLKASAGCRSTTCSDGVGQNKHTLICEHRYEWGQHPFVCPLCWTYLPICVCSVAENHHLDRYSQQRRSRNINSNSNIDNKQLVEGEEGKQSDLPLSSVSSWLPSNLDVVIWTHHKEYGLTSNTGGLLPLLLDNHPNTDSDADEEPTKKDDGHHHRCYVLMKGLPQHDEWFQTKIIDKHNSGEYLVIVLWPTDERKKKQQDGDENTTPRSITLKEAKRILLETQKQRSRQQKSQDDAYASTSKIRRVVLVAVDGTWRNARRMVSRLPNSLPRLDLSPSKADESSLKSSSSNHEDNSVTSKINTSLLAPIRSRGRSQRKDGGEGLVCTAEAVTAALVSLGLDQKDGDRILHLAKTKVDLVRQYRGHKSKVVPVVNK